MDIMPLLDELQTIARNGLFYATDPYDRERYERLMQLVTGYYGEAVDLPPVEVRRRFAAELGYHAQGRRRRRDLRRRRARSPDAARRRPPLVPALWLGRAQ
jgi:hypothetical protein